MAQINISDKWWNDPRRKSLIRLCNGNEREADGMMLEIWRVAQDYCDEGAVPKEIFESIKDFEKLFEAKLCYSRTDASVVLRGASERFDWLRKNRQNASSGGKASVAVRRKKYGTASPNLPMNTEAPSSLISTVTITPTTTVIKKRKHIAVEPASPTTDLKRGVEERRELKRYWLDEYQKTFTHAYIGADSAAFNSMMMKLHKTLGFQKTKEMIVKYFSYNNPFVVKRAHPIELLLPNLNAIEAMRVRARDVIGRSKDFKEAEKEIEDDPREEARRYIQKRNSRIGTDVCQLLSGEAKQSLPGCADGPFAGDLLSGRGGDDFADCS